MPAERYCDTHPWRTTEDFDASREQSKTGGSIWMGIMLRLTVILLEGTFKGYIRAEAVPEDERPGQL